MASPTRLQKFDGVGDAGTTTYVYDSAGNRAQQIDARGITARFEYDPLNRLVAVRYPNAAENVIYGYDEGMNGLDRLTLITDRSGRCTVNRPGFPRHR